MSQNSATHVIIIFEEDIGVEPINRRIDTIVEVINIADCDEGVVINGIRWATRNVDAPGTFAPYPESSGMFYQWNRKVAWNTTDRYVEGWDNSYSISTEWKKENDPCPVGWRVPTEAEVISLQEANSERTTLNGVNGHLFGTASNQIFLPAVGFRMQNGGFLVQVGHFGNYWIGTKDAFLSLSFDGSVGVFNRPRRASSIRCVAK